MELEDANPLRDVHLERDGVGAIQATVLVVQGGEYWDPAC